MSAWDLVPIVGGFIDNAITNNNIKSNNEADRQFQERMAQEAHQRSIDMWNRTNEFNSPSNEVKRMRAANLNPAMMYKGGYSAPAAQMAANIPAPNYHPQRSESPGGAIERSLALSNSLRLGEAQADNYTAQTAETIGKIAIQSYQKGLIEAQTGNVITDTALKHAGIGEISQRIDQSKSLVKLQAKERDKLDMDMTRSSTMLPYDIQSAVAKANLDYANRSLVVGRNGREALQSASSLKEAVLRMSNLIQSNLNDRAQRQKIEAETARILLGVPHHPNDQSPEFYDSVGGIIGNILQGAAFGAGMKGATKLKSPSSTFKNGRYNPSSSNLFDFKGGQFQRNNWNDYR